MTADTHEPYEQGPETIDIRAHGFYKMIGGIHKLLTYAMELGIPMHGTFMRRADLKAIIGMHNDQNQSNILRLDDSGQPRWDNETGIVDLKSLTPSDLESCIIDAVREYHTEVSTEQLRPAKPQAAKNLLQQYLDALPIARYDANNVAFARSILELMISQRYDEIDRDGISRMLTLTQRFADNHKLLGTLDLLTRTFDYLATLGTHKFTDQIIYEVDTVRNKALYLVPHRERTSKIDYGERSLRYAEVNRSALEVIRKGTASRDLSRKVRIAMYQSFVGYDNAFNNLEGKTRIETVERALNLADHVSDWGSLIDTVGKVNLAFYQAQFRCYKFAITGDKSNIREAIKYHEHAKNHFKSVQNEHFRTEIDTRLKAQSKTLEALNKHP